jgi:hypothetical protein
MAGISFQGAETRPTETQRVFPVASGTMPSLSSLDSQEAAQNALRSQVDLRGFHWGMDPQRGLRMQIPARFQGSLRQTHDQV